MVRKKKKERLSSFFTVMLMLLVAILGYTYYLSQNSWDKPFSLLGYQPLVVLSGSMEPALKTGDVVIVKKTSPELIKEGDIITFLVHEDVIVTHRVKEILSTAGGVSFETKGDANKVKDGSLIGGQQLLGRVILRIPYGGYFVNFVRSKWGFALLIVIPVVVLFFIEAKRLLYLK